MAPIGSGTPGAIPRLTNHPVPEKSIAVLPFENLSTEKENAFFADGVQDQILTDLAKVADLKVIGHTSVQQYKGDPERDRAKIGEQLGVAYLLEGSVQRSERRLRIIAHLIDARSNAQLWAETYDRELADVFTIQSEIAQEIVRQLQATISPQEKALIEERPTKDLAAYDLYLQAKELVDSYTNAPDPKASFLKAIRLLDEATLRDPGFVLAYCYAARAHDLLYFLDLDPTPARAVRGQVAAETALRLAPDSAEAHLSMADYYFRCQRDYHRAEKELALARPAMPNSIPFLTLSGYLHRREGRWEEGKRDFIRAVDLDPRNINASNLLADTYVLLRQFNEAIAVANRSIAAGLDLPITHLRREFIRFAATGDPEILERALAQAPPEIDVGGGETPVRILIAARLGRTTRQRRGRWRRRRAIPFKRSISAFIIHGPGTRRSSRAPPVTTRKPAPPSPRPAKFWRAPNDQARRRPHDCRARPGGRGPRAKGSGDRGRTACGQVDAAEPRCLRRHARPAGAGAGLHLDRRNGESARVGAPADEHPGLSDLWISEGRSELGSAAERSALQAICRLARARKKK